MWKNKIQQYYIKGYWTVEMVRNAVFKGKITHEDADEILGTEETEGTE